MATGPSEQLEQSEEHPDFVKELLTQKEGIQNHLKEDNKKGRTVFTCNLRFVLLFYHAC